MTDLAQAIETSLDAVASGDLIPVQCCMCGKTGLSVAEDGGPECELHDGRWVCSGECWDKASALDGGELIPATDLVDAEARGLDRAAEIAESIRIRIANGPMPEGARFDYEQAIRAEAAALRAGKETK